MDWGRLMDLMIVLVSVADEGSMVRLAEKKLRRAFQAILPVAACASRRHMFIQLFLIHDAIVFLKRHM
jgi:hypothetical protein